MNQPINISLDRIITDQGSMFQLTLETVLEIATGFDTSVDKDISVSAVFDRDTLDRLKLHIEDLLEDSSLEFFE